MNHFNSSPEHIEYCWNEIYSILLNDFWKVLALLNGFLFIKCNENIILFVTAVSKRRWQKDDKENHAHSIQRKRSKSFGECIGKDASDNSLEKLLILRIPTMRWIAVIFFIIMKSFIFVALCHITLLSKAAITIAQNNWAHFTALKQMIFEISSTNEINVKQIEFY